MRTVASKHVSDCKQQWQHWVCQWPQNVQETSMRQLWGSTAKCLAKCFLFTALVVRVRYNLAQHLDKHNILERPQQVSDPAICSFGLPAATSTGGTAN
jgi:hypothetical protein